MVLLFLSAAASMILSVFPVHAQTEADLKETIERHYAAINSNDGATVSSHHLPEMSIFTGRGHMLVNLDDFIKAAERVGAKTDFPNSDLVINDFKAQIYGNVGVALFYLIGSKKLGDNIQRGTWRVTAIWVHENGTWKEAHHHESPLANSSNP